MGVYLETPSEPEIARARKKAILTQEKSSWQKPDSSAQNRLPLKQNSPASGSYGSADRRRCGLRLLLDRRGAESAGVQNLRGCIICRGAESAGVQNLRGKNLQSYENHAHAKNYDGNRPTRHYQ
jgi:hypothetical protein